MFVCVAKEMQAACDGAHGHLVPSRCKQPVGRIACRADECVVLIVQDDDDKDKTPKATLEDKDDEDDEKDEL